VAEDIRLRVPDGRKESVQIQAENHGLSVNTYINWLLAYMDGMTLTQWESSAASAPATINDDLTEAGKILFPSGQLEHLVALAQRHGTDVHTIINLAMAQFLKIEPELWFKGSKAVADDWRRRGGAAGQTSE
jgi:hypothetical protein